ncbi:MAG: fumarate hydratase, class II [Zetaproteobacteria bacterium]|nr:fumarate hydratase, class II [Pseudobdellovibrionaceae bacterium]
MSHRVEKDSLGSVKVPYDRYWGAQTQRSLENFKIGKQKFPPEMIKAMGLVKKAAALVNCQLGKLEKEKCDLIVRVCDEIIKGDLNEHFPLVVWQTGSGTQTNMNVNEVISNRAIEIVEGQMGTKDPIHPNDHVNKSQSSNDTFPTFMHVAAASQTINQFLPAAKDLIEALNTKAVSFDKVVKIGRTHLMDATPVTLAQEFQAFADQLQMGVRSVEQALKNIYELSIGGTAVGTGLNTHPEYADKVARKIAELTKIPFHSAANKFASLAGHEPLLDLSAALKLFATTCMKVANDIRLLASGPRCGIGELILPANEPGSSIMPGKVNPTQCEALTMVAAQVIGNDLTVSLAGSCGHLQLNVFKPVIIHNILESINLLSAAATSFKEKCIVGLEANIPVIKNNLENSLMLVTALNQVIGYDKAADIAKKAWKEGSTLKKACLDLGYLSEADFDKSVDPYQMLAPKA